jgi:threonine dehydratase
MIREVLPPTTEQIEAAQRVIADYLVPTATVTMSLRGRSVAAKLENFQTTGSFKVRGALAAVHAARQESPDGAVITASAGNHGLGIAHASLLLDVHATVVVPRNASLAKVKKLRQYDIELVQVGSSYDEAQEHAKSLADQRSLRFISAFNDTNVIAGQSTVFLEMFEQSPSLEHVVVPTGGGGLISGALMARELLGRSAIRITGVQPEASAAMYHVLRGTAMSDVKHLPTIADGLAGGGDVGALTNDLIAENEISMVLVPETAIRHAVREAAETNGLILEGSAATPYAAIIHKLVADETSQIGFVVSGRNIAMDLFIELLQAPLD